MRAPRWTFVARWLWVVAVGWWAAQFGLALKEDGYSTLAFAGLACCFFAALEYRHTSRLLKLLDDQRDVIDAYRDRLGETSDNYDQLMLTCHRQHRALQCAAEKLGMEPEPRA